MHAMIAQARRPRPKAGLRRPSWVSVPEDLSGDIFADFYIGK